MKRLQRGRWSAVALLLLALTAFAVVPATAQELSPITLGTSVIGTVAADGTPVAYTFQGAFGDLVTIRAVGITPAMDPNLMLMTADQVVLSTNENELFAPATTAATIVYRLPETGTYTVVVGGTPGDFLLTLEVRPVGVVTPIVIDQPVQVILPQQAPDQIFTFNTNPAAPTTLYVNFEPYFADFQVEIRGGNGQLVGLLNADYDNACLSFSPGDELFEVRVLAEPVMEGTVDFQLGSGPCELGPEPVNFVVPTFVFEPIAIQGVCAASSFTNVNIRFGPGLEWPVIALLPARVPIQVIGVSNNGWYAVQRGTLQGWIASSVVSIVGTCQTLPAAQPPAAPPTPTFTFTPAVTVITTTPGPSPTAQVVTATAQATQTAEGPAATQPPAPTATLQPTLAPPTQAQASPTTALTAVTSTATTAAGDTSAAVTATAQAILSLTPAAPVTPTATPGA